MPIMGGLIRAIRDNFRADFPYRYGADGDLAGIRDSLRRVRGQPIGVQGPPDQG